MTTKLENSLDLEVREHPLCSKVDYKIAKSINVNVFSQFSGFCPYISDVTNRLSHKAQGGGICV